MRCPSRSKTATDSSPTTLIAGIGGKRSGSARPARCCHGSNNCRVRRSLFNRVPGQARSVLRSCDAGGRKPVCRCFLRGHSVSMPHPDDFGRGILRVPKRLAVHRSDRPWASSWRGGQHENKYSSSPKMSLLSGNVLANPERRRLSADPPRRGCGIVGSRGSGSVLEPSGFMREREALLRVVRCAAEHAPRLQQRRVPSIGKLIHSRLRRR